MKHQETMSRINSRLLPAQHKFIKDLAKKEKKGEGEILREIISYFMDNKK